MWVRNNENKSAIDNKNNKPSIGVVIAIFICTLIAMIIPKITGLSKSVIKEKTVGFTELLPGLPKIFLIAFVLALVSYLIQLIFNFSFLKKSNTTVVCEKCNKLKTKDDVINCECGGFFYNIKEMKWIEDNSTSK